MSFFLCVGGSWCIGRTIVRCGKMHPPIGTNSHFSSFTRYSAINATKFVEKGHITLRGKVVDGFVVLFVDDTGPGVPVHKRDGLFESFQESLDLLNQGTGIGLNICHNLCQLMGATIRLDEFYDSGVAGCPGARFVVNLQQRPIENYGEAAEDDPEVAPDDIEKPREGSSPRTVTIVAPPVSGPQSPEANGNSLIRGNLDDLVPPTNDENNLPESLEVLFVDDESILRKLFIRTVRKVAPTWHITEAGNGERALQLAQEKEFDVIFMDQYMPCIEGPLLGTEVVRRLRAMGFTCLICGLSANDIREDFLDAGADSFLHKPFPCKTDALRAELMKFCRGYAPKEPAQKS